MGNRTRRLSLSHHNFMRQAHGLGNAFPHCLQQYRRKRARCSRRDALVCSAKGVRCPRDCVGAYFSFTFFFCFLLFSVFFAFFLVFFSSVVFLYSFVLFLLLCVFIFFIFYFPCSIFPHFFPSMILRRCSTRAPLRPSSSTSHQPAESPP